MPQQPSGRPQPDEFAPFYGRYIDLLPDADIVETLETGIEATVSMLEGLSEQDAAFRYAPGKWSIKEVVVHLADTERIMVYRALRIARGDRTPMPGFDENAYAAASGADDRRLADLLAELAAVRRATVLLCRGLGAPVWNATGRANDAEVSVRALAWIVAGHERHHRGLLHARYLAGLAAARGR